MRIFLLNLVISFLPLNSYCQSIDSQKFLDKWQEEKDKSIRYFHHFVDFESDITCVSLVKEMHDTLSSFILDTLLDKYDIDLSQDTIFVLERVVHNSSISTPIWVFSKNGKSYNINRFSYGNYDFLEEKKSVNSSVFEDKIYSFIKSNISSRFCDVYNTLFISHFEAGEIVCYPMYTGYNEDLLKSLPTNEPFVKLQTEKKGCCKKKKCKKDQER